MEYKETDARSPDINGPATEFRAGESKKVEFAEGHVEWRAEWHNYTKYDLCGRRIQLKDRSIYPNGQRD